MTVCAGYPENGEYSLSFNGYDGSVATEVSVSEQEDFSLTAWVKINDLTVNNILISQENDWAWYVRNADGIQLSLWSSINADGMESYNEFQDGQWYHLAMRYQSNMVTHFVNGTQLGQPQTVTIPVATNNIEFGRWAPDNESINANIDEVTIWDIALSEDHIQGIMNGDSIINQMGLKGYWKFNSGQGEIAFDHSGNQNHGQIIDANWFMQPTNMGNNSISFDGVNDRVVVPHNSAYDFNDQFTIQGWFNHKSDMNERYIITKGRDIPPASSHRFWGLRSNNDGSLFFEIIMQNSGYNGFQIDPSFALDTWNHFSIVYNGSSIKFYLNGVESWSNPLSGNLQNGTYDLSIGYFPHTNLNTYGYFFEGGIDEISLWNTALSSSQVQVFASRELVGNEQGLVGYWNFNEGQARLPTILVGLIIPV